MTNGQILDPEWVKLIQQARQEGFTLEEIRSYIKCTSQKQKIKS
ncbi:anti-repressor SinI family protein [Bacillus marinisedimentorum]|nr:anti-repressor SinI family protein [Bacillus marinisedimentorum]